MQKSITRDQLLSADDKKLKPFDTPDWGGVVYIKKLSADEMEQWQSYVLGAPRSGLMANLLVRCLVDETGKRLFADSDAPALGEKSAATLSQAYFVAAEHNAIREEDVKELEKN